MPQENLKMYIYVSCQYTLDLLSCSRLQLLLQGLVLPQTGKPESEDRKSWQREI